jgi:hypothetical protein
MTWTPTADGLAPAGPTRAAAGPVAGRGCARCTTSAPMARPRWSRSTANSRACGTTASRIPGPAAGQGLLVPDCFAAHYFQDRAPLVRRTSLGRSTVTWSRSSVPPCGCRAHGAPGGVTLHLPTPVRAVVPRARINPVGRLHRPRAQAVGVLPRADRPRRCVRGSTPRKPDRLRDSGGGDQAPVLLTGTAVVGEPAHEDLSAVGGPGWLTVGRQVPLSPITFYRCANGRSRRDTRLDPDRGPDRHHHDHGGGGMSRTQVAGSAAVASACRACLHHQPGAASGCRADLTSATEARHFREARKEV